METLVVLTLSLTLSGPTLTLYLPTVTTNGDVMLAESVYLCDLPHETADAGVISVDLKGMFEGTGLVETASATEELSELQMLTSAVVNAGVNAALAARQLVATEPLDPDMVAAALVVIHFNQPPT